MNKAFCPKCNTTKTMVDIHHQELAGNRNAYIGHCESCDAATYWESFVIRSQTANIAVR